MSTKVKDGQRLQADEQTDAEEAYKLEEAYRMCKATTDICNVLGKLPTKDMRVRAMQAATLQFGIHYL